ncbi:MAG TPA: histidine phosphatase family protein [Polyangiaceae bacterium]|nr:histidine phosphatase family protein [Polyangiaceae bacterium]
MLALIRHGEYAQPAGVPSAHLPYGLTASGRGQAGDAASAVLTFAAHSGLQLHPLIDCSRLRRAWETAALMARGLTQQTGQQFSCQEFDDLAERGVGAAANLSVEAIEAILRDDPRYSLPPSGWKRDPDYRLPFQGCETLAEAGARVARHLSRAAAALAGDRPQLKLLVGHGGAFRHAACELGLLSSTQVASVSMSHASPLYLEVERLDTGADRFVHLAGDWRQRSSSGAID